MIWRTIFLITLVLSLCACRREYGLQEIDPKYSKNDPDHVPIIVAAQVTTSGSPVAPFRKSRLSKSLQVQLCKTTVTVENVLKGDVPRGETDVFYFRHSQIPGSARPFSPVSGRRLLLYLFRDHGHLRTICDGQRGCCSETVRTGPHPNFPMNSNAPIEEDISNLLFSRGTGINDEQMVEAIENQAYRGDQAGLKTLQHIVQTETPLVKEAACNELLGAGLHCGEAKASLQVYNISHLRSSGRCEAGDRLEIRLDGPIKQPVFRHTVERDRFFTQQIGTTDNMGRFLTNTHCPPSTKENAATEVWTVGGIQASPAVSYVRSQDNTHEIVLTPVANERDAYGMALSSIAVSGRAVAAYAAIELSYPTRAYYDVRAVVTVGDDGNLIRSQILTGMGAAQAVLQAPVLPWHDYRVNTDYYLTAPPALNGFRDPLGFTENSCYGASSDCQLMPLAISAQRTATATYLGSLGGTQTATDIAMNIRMLVEKQPVWTREVSFRPGRHQDSIQRAAIPKYLIYSHFLLAIQRQDEKGFYLTVPFGVGRLEPETLSFLRREAKAQKQELGELDRRARATILSFRAAAARSLRNDSKPLRQPPLDLDFLQTLRTAIAVQHMANLQNKLGPQALDELLAYSFTPHQSIFGVGGKPVSKK